MAENTATEMEAKAAAEVPKKKTFGINKNLIMLKLTLFFLYGGV